MMPVNSPRRSARPEEPGLTGLKEPARTLRGAFLSHEAEHEAAWRHCTR
jgi:hypothetical protein